MSPTMSPTLDEWLQAQPPALAEVIAATAKACERIAEAVALGPLLDLHGAATQKNSSGETQQKLDLFTDRCMAEAYGACTPVAAWVSEEQAQPQTSGPHGDSGEYLVAFDPLDGSSNIEANTSIGTIFSILRHPFRGTPAGEAGFLQPGRKQVAAGYAVYGPATVFVISCGAGVSAFTFDARQNVWRMTRETTTLSPDAREFAINVSNQRFWEKPVQRYVAECLAGEVGPRAANFNMRWLASFVAEVHRILSRGGIFLYPRDSRLPKKPGRLRLLYEAAPMAFLIEQAGGAAVTGTQRLLDIVPDTLHQKVPVILGAKNEVERIVRYHADPQENTHWPLFKERSLFVPPPG
jgi:fructose-1,6-bisphosphatase